MGGNVVISVNVNHRERKSGISKYSNFQRALVGIYDLFGVIWLRKRTHSSILIKKFIAPKKTKGENMEISLSWLIVGFLGQLFFQLGLLFNGFIVK